MKTRPLGVTFTSVYISCPFSPSDTENDGWLLYNCNVLLFNMILLTIMNYQYQLVSNQWANLVTALFISVAACLASPCGKFKATAC